MAIKNNILVLFFVLFLGLPAKTIAKNEPLYPACSNPVGVLTSSYQSGEHGIVGNPGVFTGSDSVYTVNSSQSLQCFCGNGVGIQTNWWKVSDLSQEEIEQYKKMGWQFVASGKEWGLDPETYLAMNINYSCQNSTSNSSNNSSSGQVSSSAASTSVYDPSVLGFAQTGNSKDILLLSSLSFTSFVLGIFSRKKAK